MSWFVEGGVYMSWYNTYKVRTTGYIPIANVLIEWVRNIEHKVLYIIKTIEQDDSS